MVRIWRSAVQARPGPLSLFFSVMTILRESCCEIHSLFNGIQCGGFRTSDFDSGRVGSSPTIPTYHGSVVKVACLSHKQKVRFDSYFRNSKRYLQYKYID